MDVLIGQVDGWVSGNIEGKRGEKEKRILLIIN